MRIYKLRAITRRKDGVVSYSIGIPPPMGQILTEHDRVHFIPELSPDGLLFRPVVVEDENENE